LALYFASPKKHRLNESEEGGDGAPRHSKRERQTDTQRETQRRETEKEVRGGREGGNGMEFFLSSLR